MEACESSVFVWRTLPSQADEACKGGLCSWYHLVQIVFSLDPHIS